MLFLGYVFINNLYFLPYKNKIAINLMERTIHKQLQQWVDLPKRKVLLLRGARQVGKTWSVRHLGKSFPNFIEVNFEIDRDVHSFFEENLDPERISKYLSAYYQAPVIEGKTLLFFDEIQACPEAISSLRFFYERKPNLHVIAAGSLLEFALEELPSYGVGRISSYWMYPLSFSEYLTANNEETLLQILQEASPASPLPLAFHNRLIDYLRIFMVIGGMPEVVANYIEYQDLNRSLTILDELITSFDDDFAKYKIQVPVSRLREVFQSVTYQTGNKFIYTKASKQANSYQIKQALNLLERAGLIYRIVHTHANGLPLGSEINPKKFKLILLDHGMHQRLLGLDIRKLILPNDYSSVHRGHLAEQFVGTELIKYSTNTRQPSLYYWHREKANSNAEVDYVLQQNEQIIPIEVKSSGRGRMQSLRLFLSSKSTEYGIRIALENFSTYGDVQVYPLYAVKNLLAIR